MGADAELGAMKTALSSSFKEKYDAKFLGLTVSTTKPARRRLKRRRLAKTKFYITAILAGKASELSSGVTDFVSKGGLVASLKTICSDAKPCAVTALTIAVTQASENVKKGSGSGNTAKGKGSGSGDTAKGKGSGSGNTAESKGSGSGDINLKVPEEAGDSVERTDKIASTDNSFRCQLSATIVIIFISFFYDYEE